MNTKKYFEEIGAWPHHNAGIGRAYVIGFVLSLLLTGTAYFVTLHHTVTSSTLVVILLALATAQFVAQLVYFLHLGTGALSRERLIVLCSTVVVVLILVGGSSWIIFHLNQHMMLDTGQMQEYMKRQPGI